MKKNKGQGHKLYDGVLIWLPKPLVPAEYPGTASDVRAFNAGAVAGGSERVGGNCGIGCERD